MSTATSIPSRALLIALWTAIAFAGQALARQASPDAASLTDKGVRFLHGEGVPRDVDRAVIYLCAAAARQSADAAFELGWLYYQGRDVPLDEGLAAGWFERARSLGVDIPPRLRAQLKSIKGRSPVCVGTAGRDLSIDARRAELAAKVYEIAPQYELDPAFVLEVVRAESNFDPRARSHKGALGLMQLIPATARRFGVDDPFEPTQNLHGGMAYLRWLLDHFGGDLALALAGYNAGEQAVKRYGGIPPYAETRAYVRRIMRRYSGSNA